MTTDQRWVIPTQELPVGTPLRFDLVDNNGVVLQPAGKPIDEELIDRLQQQCNLALTLQEPQESPEQLGSVTFERATSVLMSCYPPELIQAIQDSIDTTSQALLKLVDSLHTKEGDSVTSMSTSVSQFVLHANHDISATFAVIALNSAKVVPKILERVALNSTKIALLSVALSVLRRDAPIVSYEIGMSALLHDCSLLFQPNWYLVKPGARGEALRKKYRRHPVESSDLMNGLHGVSKNMLSMIKEVHEQVDGTGYPRGLRKERMMTGSVILNLADAYVSLTSPVQGEPMVPSDALAYLCFHAAQGKFCIETLQLLIESTSIYPIGSMVVLDDQSKAVVVKGNGPKPMAPTVRLLHGGHKEIDLRESRQCIHGPWTFAENDRGTRIKKSQLGEILWRTDR